MEQDQVTRKELIHKLGCSRDEFMRDVDATGGWPLGFEFVSFSHGTRYCIFTHESVHSEWWTELYTADDYYWWKISKSRKQAIRDSAVMRELERIFRSRPNPTPGRHGLLPDSD